MTDTTRFTGHGVLVTGAARDIGAACEAARTAALLREQGLAAETLGCDVADRSWVEAAVAHAVDAFGSLDVLVNSAASCTPGTPLFEDGSDEAWDRDLDITSTGAYRCCRPALPRLAASGRGAVVSIGSANAGADGPPLGHASRCDLRHCECHRFVAS